MFYMDSHEMAAIEHQGDGIPVILWKRLVTFPEVVELVRQTWNFMGTPQGHCPKSHKKCITSMLWKVKGHRDDANMYRPITLSCVDYRALHKALSNKISDEIECIVGPTQFAFIRGRTIHSIGHALFSFLLCNKKDTAVVFLDVQGAYDTVPHTLLLDILKHCKFHPTVVKICEQSLTNITTQVRTNGVLSQTIPLHRGLRQGCPSAPWQWDLINTLFVKYVERGLHPIHILNSFPLSSMSFADDNAFYIHASQTNLFNRRIQSWEKTTGTVFAAKKCIVLPSQSSHVGLWENKIRTTNGTVPVLKNHTESYSYAGMEVSSSIAATSKHTWSKVLKKLEQKARALKLTNVSLKMKELVASAMYQGTLQYYLGLIPYCGTPNTTTKLTHTLHMILFPHLRNVPGGFENFIHHKNKVSSHTIYLPNQLIELCQTRYFYKFIWQDMYQPGPNPQHKPLNWFRILLAAELHYVCGWDSTQTFSYPDIWKFYLHEDRMNYLGLQCLANWKNECHTHKLLSPTLLPCFIVWQSNFPLLCTLSLHNSNA